MDETYIHRKQAEHSDFLLPVLPGHYNLRLSTGEQVYITHHVANNDVLPFKPKLLPRPVRRKWKSCCRKAVSVILCYSRNAEMPSSSTAFAR